MACPLGYELLAGGAQLLDGGFDTEAFRPENGSDSRAVAFQYAVQDDQRVVEISRTRADTSRSQVREHVSSGMRVKDDTLLPQRIPLGVFACSVEPGARGVSAAQRFSHMHGRDAHSPQRADFGEHLAQFGQWKQVGSRIDLRQTHGVVVVGHRDGSVMYLSETR